MKKYGVEPRVQMHYTSTRSTAFFEKLIVTQLFKKLLAFNGNHTFIIEFIQVQRQTLSFRLYLRFTSNLFLPFKFSD
jgi:hypothetical protein